MTGMTSEPEYATHLEDLRKDIQGLDEESFRKRHGNAFLVHYGPIEASQHHSIGPQQTRSAETPAGHKTTPGHRGKFLVLAVRRTGRSPLQGFISVGRTRGTDVVIPDLSVSRFHALFQYSDEGLFFLQDAGTINGTFVNDQAVPARGQGDPMPVSSGEQVRFGSVEFTFLKVGDLRKLARRLNGG